MRAPLLVNHVCVPLAQMEGDVLTRWLTMQMLCCEVQFEAVHVDQSQAVESLALLKVAEEALIRMAWPDAPAEWLANVLADPDPRDRKRIIDEQDVLNNIPDTAPKLVPEIRRLIAHAYAR